MPALKDAWKKYVNLYPYLLAYELNSSFPYKELAKQFGIDPVAVRHMVEYLRIRPEVIAWVRAQYTPDRIPKWVGDFDNTKDYRGYLHSIGVALPDEKGNDASLIDRVGDDHGVGDVGDEGEEEIAEEKLTKQPSTSVANHTYLDTPKSPNTPQPTPTKDTNLPNPRKEQTNHTPSPTPSPTFDPIQPSQSAPKNVPDPIVKPKEEVLPGPNINEKVRSGEATLMEPTLAKAHQVVAERLGKPQGHDPNAVQLPGGDGGR